MRNSFSLPVYFPIVQRSDGNSVSDIKLHYSFKIMKLILFYTLLIIFAATICCQKYQQEQFHSHFSTPSSTLLTSDSSVYLSPSTQTPFPYFSMKKLPFQLLPTWTNHASSTYPTFSPYMSSSWNDEEEEIDNDDIEITNNAKPISNKIPQNHVNNITEDTLDKSNTKLNAKMINQHTGPLRRFDNKPATPITLRSNNIVESKSLNPASRRMIITSEIQRTDPGPDLIKMPSYQNSQYAQSQGVFISSTTEPAIPILRLSNEMDLDGSFSYEALGADQTHYVQHSHIENMGTDKEEQVVEGSYSYIGDDGHTYTVHYIADSNGFRATGDHLPVSPPIPEIIQRSVQYNLAQEAKKTPNSRSSWENEGNKELDINEQNSYIPRNLFTGKTPEAFSYGFSHGSNAPHNIFSAGSFEVPAKSNYETLRDQPKPKTNSIPIAPQVTFLASQGAHSPSRPVQPSTKVTSPEKAPLPQLMNYEAETKISDQEASKALWPWQYGLNANQNQNLKNSISRSSSDEDDVIINFNDMTPEQYTHMMQTDILSESVTSANSHKYNGGNNDQSFQAGHNVNNNISNIPKHDSDVSTKIINLYQTETEPQKLNDEFYDKLYTEKNKFIPKTENIGVYTKVIKHHNSIPQITAEKNLDNTDDTSFEPSKTVITDNTSGINSWQVHKSPDNDLLPTHYNKKTDLEPVFNTPYNIGINEESLNSMTYKSNMELKEDIITTVPTIEEMMKENIFLRNIFTQPHNEEKTTKKPFIERYKQVNNYEKQNNSEKEPKHFKFQSPHNNLQIINSKPLDVNSILNYVMMKNNFESIKTKQNNKPVQYLNKNTSLDYKPVQYIPIKENSKTDIEANNEQIQKQDNDYQTFNRQQQQELQGIIKNYKVLQRQKNTMQRNQALSDSLRHIKTFHKQSLPPLGRAGPSMKSYLPPTYL